MLETVREYALQKLEKSGESHILRKRHLEFFVELTESTEQAVYGPEGETYIQFINDELDNIRAAIDFGTDHDIEAALKIAGALGEYWRIAGLLSDGRERIESLLEMDKPVSSLVKVKAASWTAYLAGMQGDTSRAIEWCEYALSLAHDTGEKPAILCSLLPLGFWLAKFGQIEQSLKTCKECVALSREIGDEGSLMRSLSNLVHVLQLNEEFAQGGNVAREGLSIAQHLGSKFYEAQFLFGLAINAFFRRNFGQSEELGKKGLFLAFQVKHTWFLQQYFCFSAMTSIFGDRQPWRAAVLMSFSETMRFKMGMGSTVAGGFLGYENLNKWEEAIRQSLDESTLRAALAEGGKMTLEEAVEFTLRDTGSNPRGRQQ